MADIKNIYELYKEFGYQDQVICTVDTLLDITDATPVYLEKWDSFSPLFSIMAVKKENADIANEKSKKEDFLEEVLIHLTPEKPIDIEPIEAPNFNFLFWVEPFNGISNKVYLKFIECNPVSPMDSLDLAWDDDFILSTRKTSRGEKLSKELGHRYIFNAGKYQMLFIRSFANGSRDWEIFGVDREGKSWAGFFIEKDKNLDKVRTIRKERFCDFPNTLENIEILVYKNILFKDFSEASAARVSLLEDISKGKMLLNLWDKYSDLEYAEVEENKNQLGTIQFSKYRSNEQGTMVNLKLNPDQSSTLKRIIETNALFEVVDSRNKDLYKLVSFNNHNHNAVFEDENYSIPDSGSLELSTYGNEVIRNRRSKAYHAITTAQRGVLENLLFAIEDKGENMISVKRSTPLKYDSPKCRQFIKDKFGINDLTENQKEAVRIALNNIDDITIIQGPPGTGKTTVVSVICFRLMEEFAKREKKNEKRRIDRFKNREIISKCILASAFQNDTIEHLASKIYTQGLPTIKIGKKAQNIRAEEVFIADMQRSINDKLTELGGLKENKLIKQLEYAKALCQEEQLENAFDEIEDIRYEIASINHELDDKIDEIRQAIKKDKRCFHRISENLPLVIESGASDNGSVLMAANELLISNSSIISEEDKVSLNSILMNPENQDPAYCLPIFESINKSIEEQKSAVRNKHKEVVNSWYSDAIKAVRKNDEKNLEDKTLFLRSVLSTLKDDLEGNTPYIKSSLSNYGDCIAATNQLSGSKEMNERCDRFENVILEEAARSNPMDLIIPMSWASRRIIMVGDQNQLPHLLESDIARKTIDAMAEEDDQDEKMNILHQSLFGIMFNNLEKYNSKRVRTITLKEQFRMHPNIGDFISRTFYNGQLSAGRTDLDVARSHQLSLDWAKGKQFVFWNVSSRFPESEGRSKSREEEARVVFNIIDEICKDPMSRNLSIGVISFYSHQIDLLFQEAKKRNYATDTNDGIELNEEYRIMKDENGNLKEKMRIGSVDSFQGKEFDIVILSTVRSNSLPRNAGNERKVFGFLTLANRLNVAFSRAQRLVITVGDSNMYNDDFARNSVPGLYEVCTNICKNTDYGTFKN